VKLTNGNLITMCSRGDTLQALDVDGDRFAEIGRKDPVVIDLQGRTVIPGFCDAHTHFWFWAITLDQINLDDVTSLSESLARVSERAATRPAGDWVIGRGFNQNLWEPPSFPTRQDLDRVAPDHKVAIYSKDAHSLWVNSRALRECGVTRDTQDPEGGRILRDDHGEPTGILIETAYELVEKQIPLPKPREEAAALQRGASLLHRLGVTAVHDMGPWEAWEAYNNWIGRPLDLVSYVRLPKAEEVVKQGLRSGWGEPTLRLGGLKFFSDGALGSQTAYMFDPYVGSDSNYGVPRMSQAEINEMLQYAEAHHLACAIHAIGDRANSDVIDGAEKHPATTLRHRIEHIQCARFEDAERMARTGWIASIQPSHLVSDRDMSLRNWGEARSRYAYPFGTLHRAGVPLALGSDVPIEPVDPLMGIYAACCRKHPEDSRGPWEPDQCLDRYTALHGFTAGAAYAVGQENYVGTLAPGMRASFVILDRDILTVADDQILATQILATFHAGRSMYVNENAAPDLAETLQAARSG